MTPQPATAAPLDPTLLAEFRRQGGAIVARERGLTAACRIKLSRLASSLGFPDDQIDAAIRALNQGEPAAPPNPKVEKFRKRLRKDLAGKTRTIIGPQIEAHILAAAAQKYGLDEPTAQRALGEVAAELGLTRITASDAIDGLAAQIDQTVGDSTWLAREAWDRLRTAGAKWGIELEVVDELIDERLLANKDELYRRRFWTRATLGAAGGGAALVGLVILVLVIVRAHRTSAESATLPPSASPSVAATSPLAASAVPDWWDVDLSVEMATAESRLGGLSGACELMKSASAEDRARGYERMLTAVKAGPAKAELLEAAANIASGCHALEPDDSAAGRLRSALLALLPAPDAPLPTQPEQYDICFWAAETAASAAHREGGSEERRRVLINALSAALSVAIDPAGDLTTHRQLVRTRTALMAYQQLVAAAPKQPSAVALLQEHISSRAARHLSDEELTKAQTALLAAALPAAGKDWHAYEAAIARCVSSPDSLDVLRLTDTLQRCTDEELVESLSRLLALRAGVRPASSAKSDVVKAVRKALGATNPSAASSAADRWLALREQAEAALARPVSPTTTQTELLSQTVELAHLATMAMAVAQGEAGFASFDAGMNEPPALAAPGSRMSEVDDADGARSTPATSSAARALGASDRRELERYSSMLAGYARMQPVQRVNALRGLASLGDAAGDISPQQAEHAAKYLLAEKQDDEHAAVLALVAAIRHWKRLRLAVADAAAQSKLTAEQQHQLAEALLGRSISADSAAGQSLRRLLVDGVLTDISESAATPATLGRGDPHLVFEDAAELLAEIYRQRARLFSVNASELQAADSPAQALDLSLKPLADSLRGSSDDAGYLANLGHVHKAAKFVAGDDLRQTVAAQRLVLELSTRRLIRQRPQQAGAARQLESESLATISKTDSVLLQLRDQEATLLKLWLLYAPEI